MRMMSLLKRTKIICTIGPASESVETMKALVEAGMNVCRLNFSHGTHEQHAEFIRRIRQVATETGEPLCILQDLQGPKIRVGTLPEEGVMLKKGETIIFTSEAGADIPAKLPVTYPKLSEDVKPGQQLLLDDGLLAVRVKRVEGVDVICEIEQGGKLTSHKGLNLPETKTSISALSEKDREDVRFGVKQNVDWIALSFVREAKDIQELRELIAGYEKEMNMTVEAPIRVMAKIEKPEAIANFEAILTEVDGIMVARGDLGIEIPAEKVPILQKKMIKACLDAGKPVVVATQMLDSMIRNPRATRAEVSDVANAVIDHVDATMLSGETASGAFPVEAVKTMAATIREVEQSEYDAVPISTRLSLSSEEAMTNIASMLGQARKAKGIVVASMSGLAARLVSRYRPELPIFAVTPYARVVRQLNLSWAVRPIALPACKTIAELLEQSTEYVKEGEYIKMGEEFLVVAGEPLGQSGLVNFVELRRMV